MGNSFLFHQQLVVYLLNLFFISSYSLFDRVIILFKKNVCFIRTQIFISESNKSLISIF